MQFHHIGIFVNSLETGKRYLSAILPLTEFGETIFDPVIKVQILFVKDSSGTLYELVAPFGEGNPVAGALKTKKNILNHVAYEVEDLEASTAQLLAADCIPISAPTPAVAFGGRRVAFFLTALDFIIELIEAR